MTLIIITIIIVVVVAPTIPTTATDPTLTSIGMLNVGPHSTYCSEEILIRVTDTFKAKVNVHPDPKLGPYLPSKALTASRASLSFSNSTKANPGGFLATHTFVKLP